MILKFYAKIRANELITLLSVIITIIVNFIIVVTRHRET